ncbi:MAG: TonB-dependent receptor [Bacteroidaceae bacterium]|nr:TonB-dependent receptor [Bacteroidaceae bacterium]
MLQRINIHMKQLLGCFVVVFVQHAYAQSVEKAGDSVPLDTVRHLYEVTVTAHRDKRGADIIPVQQLKGKELERLSVHSVADAMRYFAGVQIKDYGGIGGLKTVNVRSLGTNHTGVFYDGIQLGNAQNGQIDLGRFSLDNMEALQLYNGEKSDLLQTAKDYASASTVYLQTRKPLFATHKHYNLNVSMKSGSFDTYNPSLLWEQKLTEKLSAQFSGEYMSTSGRYKFSYAKKNGYDTTEVRRNGDVSALRTEAALFGKSKDGEWRAKAYFYNSERGFPGASVREEPGKYRHQDRQWDTSAFGQGTFRRNFTNRYSLLLNTKMAYDYLHYLSDPRLDVTTMYTDNHYRQSEAYLSAAHLYQIRTWWQVSLSNDVQYNYLDADLVNFVYPTRWTLLSALSTSLHWDKLSFRISGLQTYVNDKTRMVGGSAGSKNRFTPALILGYQPLDKGNHDLSLRAFYKRIFRMPTFNDLYYTFIGNKDLKPEYTTQYNVGGTYKRVWEKGLLRSAELRADGYYNEVEDKIVAMPTSNQFRWTMMNFGLCHIWGLDASLRTSWRLGKLDVSTNCSYTFNRAMDHTDKGSPFYGGQLPYIPWHAFSAIVGLSWRDWAFNYSFIYTGERYEASANIPENYSKPWYTSDLSLTKLVRIKKCTLRITGEVNNVFNQQYEVVQCYPMPGTNFKVKINVMI